MNSIPDYTTTGGALLSLTEHLPWLVTHKMLEEMG
jgi:hypothetical protein